MTSLTSLSFLLFLQILINWSTVKATYLTVFSRVENQTVYSIKNRDLLRKVSDNVEGFLIEADPPDACTKLQPVPQYNGTENINSWVLIANWESNDRCSLLAKVRLADEAGYTAIILVASPENTAKHVPVDEWDYGLLIFPCIVTYDEGKVLRTNFSSQEYIIKFRDETIDTWVRFFVTSFLALLAILLAIGLSYCIVQMLILLIVWVRDSIVQRIQEHRINRRRRLPSSQLKKIPVQQWSDDTFQDMCTICLEHFNDKDKVRVLPCSHVFHMECIDPWLLKQRRKCPNCKRKIVFSDEVCESDTSTEDERTPLIRREGDHEDLAFTFNESIPQSRPLLRGTRRTDETQPHEPIPGTSANIYFTHSSPVPTQCVVQTPVIPKDLVQQLLQSSEIDRDSSSDVNQYSAMTAQEIVRSLEKTNKAYDDWLKLQNKSETEDHDKVQQE